MSLGWIAKQMSQTDQLTTATSKPAGTEVADKRSFNWPMFVVTLALLCTLAWNCALLWGAVHIYDIIFS